MRGADIRQPSITDATYLADGIAVVRADAVVRLVESIADGLHSVKCVSCEWKRLHVEAMALEAVAEALALTNREEHYP